MIQKEELHNVIVVGAQWGDEGKAKVVDMLAEQADVVERCHVTLPYHIEQDKRQELLRTANAPESKIGTTGRGIGPTYMDKVGRIGIRAGDLLEPPEVLRKQIQRIISEKGFFEQASLPYLLDVCEAYKAILAPYITDTVALLQDALAQNKRLLFEGAQGTLLDVDFGTYPYVTSSNSTAGGACTGTGVGPSKIDATLGVMKAYLTRVGEGPFPTEQSNEVGEILGERGQEFGTTTGRKRRTG